MASRKSTDYIVIHCSATPPSMDIGKKEIDRWHRDRGWNGIGYHYVIRRDGIVEEGRGLKEQGAHVAGYNHNSIGICLVGGVSEEFPRAAEANYTTAQWAVLEKLVTELSGLFPKAVIQGHRDFPGVNKACPCFDVKDWWIHANPVTLDVVCPRCGHAFTL